MLYFRVFIHIRKHIFGLPIVNSRHRDSISSLSYSAFFKRNYGISDLTLTMRPPEEEVLSCREISYPLTLNCASGKLSSNFDSLIAKRSISCFDKKFVDVQIIVYKVTTSIMTYITLVFIFNLLCVFHCLVSLLLFRQKGQYKFQT